MKGRKNGLGDGDTWRNLQHTGGGTDGEGEDRMMHLLEERASFCLDFPRPCPFLYAASFAIKKLTF